MIYKINTEYKKYDTEESVKTLVEDLEKHVAEISSLDLSFNTFTPPVFKMIGCAIKNMKNLNHVRLESFLDSLTFEDMSTVMTDLSNALPRTLSALELPSNALSCDFPEAFGHFLSECPLRVLDLYNCGLGEEGLKAVTACLEKLENKDNLQVLNLSKNRINRITADFGPLLNKFKHITDFRIRNNTIEEGSMAAFLNGIQNPELQILDLSDNFVCGDCHEALGNLFVRTNLTRLYLQDSKMDEGGLNVFLRIACSKPLDALPGAMEDTKPELHLDVACIDFEQDSVELLELLASKFTIKRLVLFENNYTDIEKLKEIVRGDGGVVIENEDEENSVFEVDKSIIEKLKAL